MELEKNEIDKKKKILIVEDQFIEAHDLQLILEKAQYEVIGIARSVVQALTFIDEEKPDLVFVDIFLKGTETGIDLAKKLHEKHIGFIFLSANSSRSVLEEAKKTQPYGFIVKPFREQDVLITLEIAFYRHNHGIESQMQQENILRESIDAISCQPVKWEQALLQLARLFQTYIPFDYLQLEPVHNGYSPTGLLRKDFENYEIIDADKIAKISGKNKSEIDEIQSGSPKHEFPKVYYDQSFREIFQNSGFVRLIAATFGIRSFMVLPVRMGEDVFNFSFFSRNSDAYNNEHLQLLTKLESKLAKLVSNLHNTKKKQPNIITNKKVDIDQMSNGFSSMVGNSQKMISVFDYIKRVAPSDTSVLIMGESGTGKEKVAQSIHNLSPRKNKPLVVINCGAIPNNLAESLLFGHEKGAFTGAFEKRIGKFEAADGGTVFLDEIGEMPMDIQVKLLRVLQEKEIERIGSSSPVKLNVRIIAATNRNLEDEVAAGRFRLDLYYRLHVFPITVPPLRERREDIPVLVAHFITIFSKTLGIDEPAVSDHALTQMKAYDWPGNVRELEHVIHRSMLMKDGNLIKDIILPNFPKNQGEEKTQEFSIKTIHENERDYINYILKTCRGKVSGAGGAAEILNIPASTLYSKMKKLGIKNNPLL
ncbi:formate hydrogenlyase transcriptional activator [Chryseobacterium wanjuense]|uniref:Formate hydrogenlyase transcriptional activator n=1 Tax=Chryseobacterium wanjuense TaxID=356305 RepID=A0A1I0NMH7_9FLAO|nr:sigma 54-interacting transcriptional regulator [Chryseobacterium wanjuense]SEW02464.1 formate hydrogenlyase transcriptional activator [Chryseobacterium wanjuense]